MVEMVHQALRVQQVLGVNEVLQVSKDHKVYQVQQVQ